VQDEAEDAAQEETEEILEGAITEGLLTAADIAIFPVGITESAAAKISGAAQRLVCGMSAEALRVVGGPNAPNLVGTFCQAVQAGDSAMVRAALPAIVKIASNFSANCIIGMQLDQEPFTFGDGESLDGALLHDVGMLSVLHGADESELTFALAGVEPGDLQASAVSENIPSLALIPTAAAVVAGFWMLTH
jgi:hypothetical protein